MKKTRILSLALITIFVALLFVGCSAYKGKEKTFTHGDVQITATNRFTLSEGEGKDFSLFSLSCQIMLQNVGELTYPTLGQYCDSFANELEKTMTLKNGPYKENGMYIIEAETTEDGTTVCVYNVVLQDGDDVWVAIFACEESEYKSHEPYIKEWASSIKFVH